MDQPQPLDARPEAERPRLALIEVYEHGRIARAVDVTRWPLRLGRALDNEVVLDDPHIAPHHARLSAGDAGSGAGMLTLEVLATGNGVVCGSRRLAAGESLALPATGATLILGTTRLQVRLPGETLAPEKLLLTMGRARLMLPAAAGAALLALQGAQMWLSLDPGADTSAWLPQLVALPVALAAWCGLWALLSKLFQHRFDFSGHLRIALPWLLAIGLTESLWPQAAAALDLPWLWQLGPPLQAALGVLLLRAHLDHVLPVHRRVVAATLAALVLVGGGISLTLLHRATDSYAAAPYMSTLPLPALRLRAGVPPSKLIQAMAPLAGQLAQRVKAARDDEEDDGGEAPAE